MGNIAVAARRYDSLGLTAFYGDLNRDGVVDFDDINAFVALLSGG